MTYLSPTSPDLQAQKITHQKPVSINKISKGKHSFRSLGPDYSVDIPAKPIANSRLILFNHNLAKKLNLDLPKSDDELERIILKNFSWFKDDDQDHKKTTSKNTKTFFATRYLDSEDKTEGGALGDGRAVWVGEIVKKLESGGFQYFDVVLKGAGATPLAWFNHAKENHKDGLVSLTEAVHEYIYSAAAKNSGISAVGVLAVIELPFIREVDNEKAVIIVRIGNHLRFGHYRYFSDDHLQLQTLFEYGLKRDLGLSLTHSVISKDVCNYLDLIVTNLASDSAIYFDIHAVHGSPTFGNMTSCGGTIDFSTFMYIDAHHGSYSYMPDGVNLLGGEWGQTEQFFNLFSHLIKSLKKSGFEYSAEIKPVEYFLRKFTDQFELILTARWLRRIGLSESEIDRLSPDSKEHFYETVKSIYELKGSKKIRLTQGRVFLAAFEPRKILSETAKCLEHFEDISFIWNQLFKVNRKWGTYKLVDAKPFINVYRKSIIKIKNELNASKKMINTWQQRSQDISLSERTEPGVDFFYNSERYFASEAVLRQINAGNVSWRKIGETADISISQLIDHGLYR